MLQNNQELKLFHIKKNLGYDAAIAILFEKVKTENPDVMITLDGDGQHDPN